jgi:hypothetical protein
MVTVSPALGTPPARELHQGSVSPRTWRVISAETTIWSTTIRKRFISERSRF